MRNWIVLVITFTFIIKVVFAEQTPTTMDKKWHYLNKLVDNEIKTILKRKKNLGPRLRYRLVELYSEKTKLLREKENKDFINSTDQLRQGKGKEFFYKDSVKYFDLAKDEGLNVTKKFPRFIHNGNIYYTLALNERDYNQSKDIIKYLKLSLKYAEAGSPIVHKAKVELAEYNYNNKNYSTAVRYYKDVLKYKRDQWYSKHLYNAAWCHMKINDNDVAISLLKQAFEYSQKSNYINIEDQVLKSIGLFYVTIDKPLEAVNYYMNKAKDPHPHLINLADMTSNRGNIKDTEIILDTALKIAITKKKIDHQAQALHKKLALYHHFKRSNKIYETAKLILDIKKKNKLNKEINDDTVDKVTNHVGFLQVSLTSNIDRFDEEEKKSKSQRIIKFFNLLTSFRKENTDQYRFYQAETLYAVSEYIKAAKLYIKALEFAKKKKTTNKVEEDKFKRKILDSLFSTLAVAEMTSNKIDRFHKYAYANFLNFWPKDEKSPDVYQKLFNIHMKEKNDKKATETFNSYYTNFPSHNKIHKGMTSLIVDYYVKTKNHIKLSEWMIKFNQGFLQFDKEYIEKGLEVLASMLFEQYEKLGKEGKFEEAVKGYIALYENEKYPRIIHARSAYNISILYLDKIRIDKSLSWLEKSLKKYNKKEKLELVSKFYAIAENYYLLQDFSNAAKLSLLMTKEYCQDKTKELKNFYNNTIIFSLLEANYSQAENSYQDFKNCNIKENTHLESAKTMISFHSKNRNYDKLKSLYSEMNSNNELKDLMIVTFIEAYWDLRLNLNSTDNGMKEILTHYKNNEASNTTNVSSIENIETFEKYEIIFKTLDLKIVQDKSKFSEEAFNQKLQSSFAKLEEFTKSGEDIISEKDPIMTLAVYQMLEKKYSEITKSLSDYTPQQMPKEYVSGFKKQMSQVASQLETKGNNYKEVAIKTMKDNKIFNKFGKEISGVELIDNYRYPASKLTLPLDF